MARIILLLIITGWSAVARSQASLSMSQFLATAKNEESVMLAGRKLDFLQNTSYELPWVDELEFRTQTNDFMLREQQYQFRVSPNSPGERRTQNKYHEATIRLEEQNRQWIFAAALRDRYNLIAGRIYLQQLLPLQEHLRTLYRDRLRVLKSNAVEQLSDGDLRDLARTEADIQELELDLMETRRMMEAGRLRIARLAPGADSIRCNGDEVIGIERMAAMVGSQKPDTTDRHLLLVRRRAQIDLAQRAYERELASTKKVLDFVQVRYGGRNYDFFRELVSVGLGFRLPIKGNDKIDLNNRKLDLMEREHDYQLSRSELESEQAELSAEIGRLAEEYRYMVRQQSESQAAFSLEQYRRSGEARPLVLLALQETILRQDLTLVRLHRNLMEHFIDWLDASGIMAALPLTNYLSASPETF